MKKRDRKKVHKLRDDPNSFTSEIQRPEIRARLINLARRKEVPIDDCEDIVSEAISQAISKQQEYDAACGAFFLWISGITKNVIRSYYRKLNTQKRKPEGGLVSLDAICAPDEDKVWEPKNTCVQTDRRSSEQIEHFTDIAGLSLMERKTIHLGLDKETKYGGAKFSSSTARRAMRKLRQARTDEEFIERPRGPEPSECAYGNIPRAEQHTALLYEVLRRTPWFANAIACWRETPGWKDVQTHLESERVLKRFPLVILPEHWPEQLSRYRHAAHQRDVVIRGQFEAAIDIALAFREWPRVSYCQLDPNDRRQRLRQFGWQFGPEPFWEIDERTFEFFANAADEKLLPIVSFHGFLEFVNQAPISGSHAYSSTHVVRVDWQYPLKTIVKSFERWASEQPSHSQKKKSQAGRSRTTRLVGLACIRLTEDFGLSKAEAMSWLKAHFGGPVPSTSERLERAAKATRDGLKDFLPPPAEIGI